MRACAPIHFVRSPSRLRRVSSAVDAMMVTVDDKGAPSASSSSARVGKRTPQEGVDDGESTASDESNTVTMECIIAEECERERREGGRRPSGEETRCAAGQRGGEAAADMERELAACEEEIREKEDGHGPTQALYAKKATIEISSGRFVQALESAKRTVEAQPLWFRGYVLLSEAMFGLDPEKKRTETRETVRASLERALFLQPNLSRDAAFRELCAEIGPINE
jgi:hypothetical protein